MQVIGKLMAAPVLQQRNFTGRDGAAGVVRKEEKTYIKIKRTPEGGDKV